MLHVYICLKQRIADEIMEEPEPVEEEAASAVQAQTGRPPSDVPSIASHHAAISVHGESGTSQVGSSEISFEGTKKSRRRRESRRAKAAVKAAAKANDHVKVHELTSAAVIKKRSQDKPLSVTVEALTETWKLLQSINSVTGNCNLNAVNTYTIPAHEMKTINDQLARVKAGIQRLWIEAEQTTPVNITPQLNLNQLIEKIRLLCIVIWCCEDAIKLISSDNTLLQRAQETNWPDLPDLLTRHVVDQIQACERFTGILSEILENLPRNEIVYYRYRV